MVVKLLYILEGVIPVKLVSESVKFTLQFVALKREFYFYKCNCKITNQYMKDNQIYLCDRTCCIISGWSKMGLFFKCF